MAKSSNQKLKLLYLMTYLLRNTDQAHPVTVQQMIDELSRHDIQAERKSIYDDLEALRLYGLDLIQVRGKTTGYYIGSREFELPELKILVDSVQSSKFVTHKKTLELIKKLERLASIYDGQLLQRQVYVRNRVKSMNESVYYNVDEISNAITNDSTIRFKYFEYTVSGERVFRKSGSFYEISPFALIWDDENYYMLGYDSDAGIMKHYRVDKMSQISSLSRERSGKSAFEGVDMAEYSKQVFGMFTGELRSVRLRFENSLAGTVLDRFGRNAMLVPDTDGHFTITAEVAVSPKFYSWVFAFGTAAEILGPEDVRAGLAAMTASVAAMYNNVL